MPAEAGSLISLLLSQLTISPTVWEDAEEEKQLEGHCPQTH